MGITPELKNGDAASFLEFVREHDLEAGGSAGAAVPLHVQSFDLATVLAVRPKLASPCVWLVSKRPDEVNLAALAAGVDALFTDFPGSGVASRDRFVAGR